MSREGGGLSGRWLQASPTWQEVERRAQPWQAKQRAFTGYDVCGNWVGIGPPPPNPNGGVSQTLREYSDAARYGRSRQTLFYDGFVP